MFERRPLRDGSAARNVKVFLTGPIAQRSEPPAHNRSVPGSNPGGPTTRWSRHGRGHDTPGSPWGNPAVFDRRPSTHSGRTVSLPVRHRSPSTLSPFEGPKGATSGLGTRAEISQPSERRCILPDCVARRVHTPGMRTPRAWLGRRLDTQKWPTYFCAGPNRVAARAASVQMASLAPPMAGLFFVRARHHRTWALRSARPMEM